MAPRQRFAILAVLSAASLWGCWSLFLRPTGLPGAVTAPILCAGVAALTTPRMLVERRHRRPRWNRATLLTLLVYSAADAFNIGTFFQAMSTTTVSVAVLTHSVAPIIVSLLGPWIERVPSRRAVPAAAIALLGLTLVLEPWRDVDVDSNLFWGATLGLASALGYAVTVFSARRLSRDIGPATALSSHAAISALLLVPFGVSGFPEVELTDIGWLALAVVLPGSIAGLLFVIGLRVIGSAKASVLALLEPLVACTVGYLAFGERLSSLATLGASLVLVAALFVAAEGGPAKSGVRL